MKKYFFSIFLYALCALQRNINFNGSHNDKFIICDSVSRIAARMENYKLSFSSIVGNIVIIFFLCTLEHVSQLKPAAG